jgi:hypothetical protein
MDKAKGFLNGLQQWWQSVFAGLDVKFSGTQGEASLSTILGELQLNVQRTPVARDQMIEEVQKRTNEFIETLNRITQKVEETNGNKPLLVIVEDIDKVSDEAATEVFLQHTQMLLAPQVGFIYTFPKALCYLPDYAEIAKRFHGTIPFPNFVVQYAKKSRKKTIPSGFGAVKKLVLRRIEPHLIEEKALEELVLASSGVPYWVVKIMKDASANALAFGKPQIEVSDVRAALMIVTNDFKRQLQDGDLEFLLERHNDNSSSDGDKQHTLRMMYIGALIEYENGEQWCDVHRALIPLLPKRRKPKP